MAAATKKAGGAAAAETTEAGGLLDQMLSAMPSNVQQDEAKDIVGALVQEVMSGQTTVDSSVVKTIRQAIAGIDKRVSKQLSAVMHHPEFAKLEGSWRGLHHLVMNSQTSKQLRLKVLNVKKTELKKDLDKAVDFDASKLFKDIYDAEFGMPGGSPYSALIGDYEFSNHPEDVDLLRKVSGVAAAAHCPFISGVSPQMFGMDSFADLQKPLDIEKLVSGKKHTAWNAFRDTDDARYVSLVMPRTLARMPYGKNTKPVEEFNYEELPYDYESGESLEAEHDDFCWMNAAYAYGAVLTRAFNNTGWCTAIRGRENGGTVDNLPVYNFQSDDGEVASKCPTEIAITGRRENELSKQGFIPLCHYKDTDFSVFFGAQTCQKPKKYDQAEATDNAAISARLPYIMAASRIAHYLKCIAVDKIGSFMEREDCEDWLNTWIKQYVNARSDADAEMKAKFPLAEAEIRVTDVPGQPGVYNATALLRPWLQLEELHTAVSMVAKIPARG